MPDDSFGNWIDDAQWDAVQLAGTFLPGVATVSRFADGLDIDVQKKRKKEKARLRDNGIAPCAFLIKVELTAADWPAWVKVLPLIKPRRPGAVRAPMKIVHPLPNIHGVEDVYVKEIEYDEPTARKGLVVTIHVGEWFEEEKDTKTIKQVGVRPHRIDPNDGAPPTDTDNMSQNSFRNTDNVVDPSVILHP